MPNEALTTPTRAAVVEKLNALIPVQLLQGPEVLDALATRWTERHRAWHGPGHLLTMLEQFSGESSGPDRDALLLAALYHDAVYDPLAADNEEASARLLLVHARDARAPSILRAAQLIEASKWAAAPEDSLTWKFWEADCRPLASDLPLAERIAYERAIFREYQFAPWPVYRAKRAEFLRGWAARFPQQRAGAECCLELLSALVPRVAVYPGSFNPFHRGHLSILRQAERVFDKVILGLAVNRQKQAVGPSLDERRVQLQATLRYHEVAAIGGLLTEYLEASELPLTVVRGVRDGTDLEAELRYARFIDELRAGTNVLWIGCTAELQHLSSSAIRELRSIESAAGDRYVPTAGEIYGLTAWSHG